MSIQRTKAENPNTAIAAQLGACRATKYPLTNAKTTDVAVNTPMNEKTETPDQAASQPELVTNPKKVESNPLTYGAVGVSDGLPFLDGPVAIGEE